MKMVRREILDSEDDGDDFDDQDYGDNMIPIAGAAPEAEDVPEQQQATAAPPLPSAINNVQVTNTSTLSTDPSFFERVYEGQHIGWEGQFLQTTSDDISTQVPPMPPSTRKATRAKAATQKQAGNNDIVDLTTPRKAADASVWDFPGSSLPPTAEPGPAAAPSSLRSTRSARKRTQVVDTQDKDPYAFPASTPARSSKRTRRSLSAAAESSPVVVPNTTTEMYVATSELTPSQKEQYATVSLPNSSTSEVGVPLPTLPLQLEGTEVHKSSGMTLTTIAYTTPSRIGSSSRREMPSTGGVSGENVTPAGYQSSPDVLNDMAPPSTSSSKRKGRGKTDMEPPTSTASGRKAKKRRTIQDADDEGGDLGAENDHSHISEDISTDIIPQTEPEPQPEPQPKKKRGRKKKEPAPQPEETVPEVELSEVYQPKTSLAISEGQIAPVPDMMESETVPETSEPVPEPEPVVEEQPPAKKRRGRPKKADTVAKAQPVVIDVEEEVREEVREPLADMPTNSQPKGKKTPAANGKGGRKKKEVVVDSDEDGENGDGEWGEKQQEEEREEPVKEKKAVQEVVIETKVEMKAEVKKVKDEKPAAGATPIKPAGYRVGLSKRSRIAPLLKSLKKT